MTTIFVSHSSRDNPQLVHLLEVLKASGATVWYDQWALSPGDSLRQRVHEGINECDYFIIALSRYALRSKWVSQELDAALIKDIERDSRSIIVVLLGGIHPTEIPLELRGRVWVDLRRSRSARYKAELQKLRRFLSTVVGPRIWLGSGHVRIPLQRLLDTYVVALARQYPSDRYQWRF